MSCPPGDSPRGQLLQRLIRLRRRRLFLESALALMLAAALALGLGTGIVLLEAALYLPPAWRLGLLAGLVAISLAVPAVRLWRGLRDGLSLHRVALEVEDRAPELSQRLVTAFELGDQRRESGPVHSAQLLEATTAEAATILASLETARLTPARQVHQGAGRLAGLGLFILLLGLATGEDARHALHRVLHPGRSFQRPQRTHLRVTPAAIEVIRGDDVQVFIHIDGVIPATMEMVRQESADRSTEEVVLRRELTRGDSVDYTFEDVRRPFEFSVEAGDGHAGPIAVTVIDPPSLSRLRLAYEYPEHTGLPSRVEEEGGDIRAPSGTVVDFSLAATKPLSTATLVLDDTLRLPAEVVDDRARLVWRLPTPEHDEGALRHYRIDLLDRQGVSNRDPIQYTVHILRDGAPEVSIPIPGRDADLPESQQVAIEIEASDDFGLSRIDLVFRVNEGPEERLLLARDAGRQVHVRHVWDLSDRDLLPEDRVTYRAEAFDNDAITGPKLAATREFVLRFPSLYELFSETSETQQRQLESLEELAEQEADAQETVERMRREVLRSEELTWEQRQELESALVAEEERARQVEELAREMTQTMEQLEEGGLSSGEMLEKMEEIRDLMAAVTSPELLEALQSLQQAMDTPDPEDLAEALRQFAQDQEAFQERLERTLALLRQVKAEQRLLAAVSQAQDLEQRQSTINDELDSDQPERLAAQESSLSRDTDRLQQELDGLSDDFAEISQPTAQALASEAETMEQQKLSARMQQMEQSLISRANPQARREGEGLQEDLARLSQSLQNLQGEFDGSQRQQMKQQLWGAMAGLVDLSQRQEDLSGASAELRGPRAAELATEQQALARGVELIVEQIGQVSRKTLALDSGLATTIGYALTRMEEAARRLGKREASRASREGGEAVGFLNEAVMQLRQSVDNLEQAGTPSAFGEAMEKMMGLSQQQMNLNQATQQALQDGTQPGRQGQRGGGRDSLPRLAARQRQIYRALGDIERSLRGQRSMESRVDAIRKDMESVLARMQRNAADPLVRQGQERVLQRMLDASRSIRNRGFEKRRRSETAVQRLYSGPEWLPVDLGQRPDAVADAMRRALAGDYPVEYRQLIRRYYETVYEDLHGGANGSLP
ncbi:MAG: hypothetical protein QGI32_16635 [Candidatus Latescibacteria bacterium]|nr:hypothetical protein [Candidatus Latescibacterota bacterium]